MVQGAYLTLAPGELRLELDLTPGAAVLAAVLRALDPDGDRRIADGRPGHADANERQHRPLIEPALANFS